MTLREAVEDAKNKKRALAHFNFSDSNQLKAIADAAKDTRLPVIVGLSEGEREHFPLSHARAIVNIYREQGVDVYLNADHTYSVEKVQRAIAAGVDSVVVDGAKLSFEENILMLSACVKYARASGRDVLVEGELGYIGTSSTVLDAPPEGAAVSEEMMTKPEELKRFAEESEIDLVAPAVGNIHGVVKSGQPKLSIERIRDLSKASKAPLVLHGGSGSSDEEFKAAIEAGIVIIHINTDLRVLYHDTLMKTLEGNPSETTPYRFLSPAVEEMKRFVTSKLELFSR
ncbi:MAG TPA: class II fructose-bisphosphate aldolase [Candidatus Paceibacterota bacterium]|nr:class II fructose-bisphosphate aldolase [Candidatus Paceibacterota bacterium]